MPRRAWIGLLGFWPGLPQIWTGQEVFGLLLAGFFAGVANLAIASRWVWTEAFAAGSADFFAAAAVLTWWAAFAYTAWWLWLCHPDRHRQEIDRLYREAREAYLQGRWNEARKRIERVLAMNDADADALMQLGAIHVRTHRPDLARKAYRQCLEQDGGAKWRWEVERALAALDRPGA